jgi:choline dehydrogenase-like flavoprotein
VLDGIVVGSGFGGAVTACRLAQAGLRVLVLERGRRYEAGDFPAPPPDSALLPDRGFDVWILEWRSSPHIVDPLIETRAPLGGSAAAEGKIFEDLTLPIHPRG